MGLLPIGGVLFGENKASLKSSRAIEKTIFANPDMTDVALKYTNGKDAQVALEQFGKFAKNIKLEPAHTFKYINAHGAAQLYDATSDKNVISTVAKLKHPILNFLKVNVVEKFKALRG